LLLLLLPPGLALLLFGLPALLIFGLSSLLFLRLSFVAATLLLSLPALLILFPATATTFGLRWLWLRFLLIPLLPSLVPLPLPVFTVLRFLGTNEPSRTRQRQHSDCRCQRKATKVIAFHDYLLKERAEGKVISLGLSAIPIPRIASSQILRLLMLKQSRLIRYGYPMNRIGQTGSKLLALIRFSNQEHALAGNASRSHLAAKRKADGTVCARSN